MCVCFFITWLSNMLPVCDRAILPASMWELYNGAHTHAPLLVTPLVIGKGLKCPVL